MAQLALTRQRRAELLALLDDEERLRVEHPAVHQYLALAPRLAGAGDPVVDAAFDLRFAHFVTGGRAVSADPYWDIVGPFVSDRAGRRVVDAGHPDGSPRLAHAQMLLQSVYTYAVPAPETVAWLAGHCAGRRVVEPGAGRGYWAARLAAAGVAVAAYDVEPPGEGANRSFPSTGGQADVWHPVLGVGEHAPAGRDDVLFLCWPPGWGDTMASTALAAFEAAGGGRLAFVGQRRGGMTGDSAFFDALAARWTPVAEDPRHVSWWNLPDVAQIWTRHGDALPTLAP